MMQTQLWSVYELILKTLHNFVLKSGLLSVSILFGLKQLLKFIRYLTWESNKLDYYLLHLLDINFSKQDVCTLYLLIFVSVTTSCRIYPKLYHMGITYILHRRWTYFFILEKIDIVIFWYNGKIGQS
jgi:hypothetical protein